MKYFNFFDKFDETNIYDTVDEAMEKICIKKNFQRTRCIDGTTSNIDDDDLTNHTLY